MIQFSKLRLHGFKSFVDRTELDISPGLNGIVGPNGCGKSNLVEALRWSMGENSSKRMRGDSGSMEDVIFNGTAQRPARNVAEVSVLLDNSKRTAPAPYNTSDEIEVVRRIERDHGSSYRINGKPVRARDVQILYADLMSGAGSPFIVSQGKVTQMIQAKPAERRRLLEEAAGISGLYARRHEAELRLRATDANLKRLEDLLGGMEARLQDLKKQARQANRYRNLSAQIRQLEVMIASLDWRRTKEKLMEVESTFHEAESAVAERMTVVSQLTQTQNVQAQDLPDLRKAETEAAAALQAQKLALQRLEDESERLSRQLEDAKSQLRQLEQDRLHEKETLEENTNILKRMEEEEKTIQATRASEDHDLDKRENIKLGLQKRAHELENSYTALMEEIAADKARRQSLEQQIQQDEKRREIVSARLNSIVSQLAEQADDNPDEPDVDGLRHAVSENDAEIEKLRGQIGGLEATIEELRQKREAAHALLHAEEKRKSSLESEINSLEAVVKAYIEEGFRPVFEDIQTDKGFELALSRALGDTLMASTDPDAPVVWGRRNDKIDTPSLPPGARSLIDHVRAPEELNLALRYIGLVDTDEDGNRLAGNLKPGQALVSCDGGYWRWDGLQVRVTASDRHAIQLRQKNRLADLARELPAASEAIETQRAALEKKEALYKETREELTAAKEQLQASERKIREKRATLEKAISARAEKQAAQAKLQEARSLAEADLNTLAENLAENHKALAAFNDPAINARQEKTEALRADLSAAREELQSAISDYEVFKQEHNRRAARLQAIGDERVNLQNRCIRARERLKELDEREEILKTRAAQLKERPAVIRKESEALLSRLSAQEQEKGRISDKLAACEAELADTTRALKQAETALAEVREARAHAQATAAERQRHLEEIKQYIHEQFGVSPEELAVQAALSDEAMPELESLKEDREKAVRSRDLIGPVNLRAEQEAEELEQQLGGILNERGDLVAAVEELRQGIQKLNKEARERLNAAFAQVNGHFREMFTRLFSGGKAHLALIESDDPLEAGLEIYAQPPGKTLQSLSLLSGGEQTLTAIALIFAMFLTNPAPICVLDEVDAPLDDANVDRFCDLLEEFADRGETRFLLITHHRLTMARMDRLYGVTMAEKGVSQLVSVDLNQQFDFLEAAE